MTSRPPSHRAALRQQAPARRGPAPRAASSSGARSALPPGRPGARRIEPARGDFLEQLVHLLDAQFRIPVLGVRIGLDPILGLLPGAGDVVATTMGMAVLLQARREGAAGATLARMSANLLLDLAIGAIPLAGDVFDIWFKANKRNLRLLHEDRARRTAAGPGR